MRLLVALILIWNCYTIYSLARTMDLLETTVAQLCEDRNDITDVPPLEACQ